MIPKLYLLILILLLSVNNVYCQWIQTNGPYGDTKVSTVIESGSNIYAFSSCGIHVNNSLTGRWKLYDSFNFDMFSLFHTSDVFDNIGDSIFFFDDNQLSLFDLSNSTIKQKFYGAEVNSVECTDSCVYLGTKYNGFVKLIGFSRNWQSFSEGLPNEFRWERPDNQYYFYTINDICLNKEFIFCGTKQGLYRAKIGDYKWSVLNSGIPEDYVEKILIFGDSVFVGIKQTLYLSINNGDNWKEHFVFPSDVSSINKIGDSLFVVTKGDGIFIQSGKDSEFTSFNNGLKKLDINSVDFLRDTLICSSGSKGFYFYDGNEWKQNIEGMICSRINYIVSDSEILMTSDWNYVYRSENGNDWIDITPNNADDLFIKVMWNDGVFSVSATNTNLLNSTYISITKNKGKNWDIIADENEIAGIDPYKFFYFDSQFYVIGEQEIFYKNDFSSNWNTINVPKQLCHYLIDFQILNKSLCVCEGNKLLKLKDKHLSIVKGFGLPAGKYIWNFASTRDALFVFVENDGIYVSFNNGEYWQKRNDGLEKLSTWGFYSYVHIGNNLILATQFGIYVTSDFGMNWYSIMVGMPDTPVYALEIHNDTIFAGTKNGIWKHDIKSLNLPDNPVIPEFPELRSESYLFPNPASEFCFVVLSEEVGGTLKVFSLDGKLVMEDEFMPGLPVDISVLKKGIYIALAKTDKISKSFKLTIN